MERSLLDHCSVPLTALALKACQIDIGPPLGGDQSQAAKSITIWAVLLSFSVAIVTVRFIARAKGSKHFGWDDWTMLAALVRSLSTRIQRSSLTAY